MMIQVPAHCLREFNSEQDWFSAVAKLGAWVVSGEDGLNAVTEDMVIGCFSDGHGHLVDFRAALH